METQTQTYYEKYGGKETVDKFVQIFYEKMVADPNLTHFFEGIDMERLKAHDHAFTTMILGGPMEYKGRTLREAHKNLDIKEPHWDATIDYVAETLDELGFEEGDVKDIVKNAEGSREDVLNL